MTKLLYRISSRTFITIAIFAAMLPFLNLRVLRMAGDEKVYISQAIEMARNGTWFYQHLAGQPDYYKGPLHYIFIRLGTLLFGNQIIAGTWMNLAFALAAALAMYHLGRKRWDDKTGFLLGIATGLNVGVYSHALASQMEVELFAFYAFAATILGLGRRNDVSGDIWFWLAAGIVGWLKSPLYSVLIGTGGIVYWLWSGQLSTRIRSPRAWLSAFCGVAVCALGYAPAFFGDHDNFIRTFIQREQMNKVNNARSWTYVVQPLSYFLMPWTFLVLGGLLRLIKWALSGSKANDAQASKKGIANIDIDMVKLGLSIALPSILFFSIFRYKGQNYNLPTMPALLLFGFACFSGKFPRSLLALAGAVGTIAFAFVAGLVLHFWPLPIWWSIASLAAAFLAMAVFALSFLVTDDFRWVAVGAAMLFFGFGAFVTPLGEREMIDIRGFVEAHPEVTLHYYDLEPSIWSEWGLLQFTLHKPIYGLHKSQQLAQAIKPGHAILVQNTAWLNQVMNYWRSSANTDKTKRPQVISWTRWLTKGKTEGGGSRWKAAWISRDLRQLEREFSIIWFQ